MRVALVGAEFEENLAIRCLWGSLQQAGHVVRQVVFNGPGDVHRAFTRTEVRKALDEAKNKGGKTPPPTHMFEIAPNF